MSKTTKNKMELTEDELLSEDGIFAAKFSTYYDNAEKCCMCGCTMMPGEDVLQLYANGDIVHRGCWQEYAEEYTASFGKEFVWNDDSVADYV